LLKVSFYLLFIIYNLGRLLAACLNKRDIKSGVKFGKGKRSAVYWSETETLVKRGVRPLKRRLFFGL